VHEIVESLALEIFNNPNLILSDEYSYDERRKDWNALIKKSVIDNNEIIALDSRSRPGHNILDHFHKHFFKVENYKGKSVVNTITVETLKKALLSNIAMHTTPYKSEIRKMLIMSSGLGLVSKYKTTTTKAIVQYFQARRVFDPCIGWGGRMLGTISAYSDSFYIGCEPDTNTYKSLTDMLQQDFIDKRATIINDVAENSFQYLKLLPKFDMILTSPPYFNLEIYTSGNQSINTFTTWDDWVSKWLKVVILSSLEMLKEGGVSCWSVKNFKTDKAYPLADETIKIHKEAGWDIVKTVKITGSARPGQKRVEDGKEKQKSEEETYCFKKREPL